MFVFGLLTNGNVSQHEDSIGTQTESKVFLKVLKMLYCVKLASTYCMEAVVNLEHDAQL